MGIFGKGINSKREIRNFAKSHAPRQERGKMSKFLGKLDHYGKDGFTKPSVRRALGRAKFNPNDGISRGTASRWGRIFGAR
jgi:hypothetical protein